MAAPLITIAVMVAEKPDKTASPMLNGGMAEAVFKPEKRAGRTALSNAAHPVARELRWISA